MARLDLLMFSVSAVILVLTVGGASFFLGQVREAAQRAQTRLGELGADLERVVSAVRTVRMAGAEDVEATRLSGTAAAARDAGIRVARSIALVSPVAQVAASGALLAVLLVGAARVGAGSLELSTLVSFLLYTLYLLTPLNGLIDGTSVIRRAQGTLERIGEVLELPIEDTGTSPRSEPPLRAKIEKPALSLEGVHFGYADRSEVLSDVNLRVAAGRRIALVGPSGGGKTTLFSLICRLHTPRYGTIAVAGHDLSTAGYRARALVALVEQDSPILFGSVRDNLLIGVPDVNDDRLREVVERVQMTDEIDKMPNGMDTDVGEHGQFISGGQRQRLAIARALLREPSLLLLDEPTSSLDEDNERAVLTVIRELPPSQSALIISHRPSTLEMVDEILLLDQGQVRTIGSYENLARLDPEYRFHH